MVEIHAGETEHLCEALSIEDTDGRRPRGEDLARTVEALSSPKRPRGSGGAAPGVVVPHTERTSRSHVRPPSVVRHKATCELGVGIDMHQLTSIAAAPRVRIQRAFAHVPPLGPASETGPSAQPAPFRRHREGVFQ
jgi:hypothetical protein